MRFHTRKWVKPEDLNPNETLFGGRLLQWIDEEAALYALVQLDNPKIVTKYISDINFQDKAEKGDIVEIGMEVVRFGKTSITIRCEARNMMTRKTIITIDNITMVNLGSDGKPAPHHKTQIEFVKDRLGNNDKDSE
jgi:acyl-CoA thioesterase YciA